MIRGRTRTWRVLAVGVTSGVAGLFVGCQSPEPIPYQSLASDAPLYPGLHAAPVETTTPRSPAPAVVPAVQSESTPLEAPVIQEERIAPSSPLVSEEPIDLGVALKLAGVDNPTVNLARERVREAVAGQLAARSLLLPTMNVGGNYHLHGGSLQRSPGNIQEVNLQSLYLGAGAGTIGGNPAAFPGVRLFAHLGDAVYEPLAARQRVSGRVSEAQAVQNQILLEVSLAYLNLVGAEARLDILRRGEAEVAEIARVTSEFAKAGQGTPANANRAAANLELVRRQVREAEGWTAAASARLCQLLNLDPSVRLRTPGGPMEVIRLIPEDTELESLLATAERFRPELLARTALIRESQVRVRQEHVRPLIPIVSVGYSGGAFGGGSNLASSRFSSLTGRSDFDVLAVWNVQYLGVGNLARVRAADAVVGQAVAGYDATLNQVRQEVASAQADAQAASRQIGVARTALNAAEEGYQLESERVRKGEGRPLEALDSFRQLLDARQELLRALIAFDAAQFRLFVAIGNNPAGGSGCVVPQHRPDAPPH